MQDLTDKEVKRLVHCLEVGARALKETRDLLLGTNDPINKRLLQEFERYVTESEALLDKIDGADRIAYGCY